MIEIKDIDSAIETGNWAGIEWTHQGVFTQSGDFIRSEKRDGKWVKVSVNNMPVFVVDRLK